VCVTPDFYANFLTGLIEALLSTFAWRLFWFNPARQLKKKKET
jgi:hypothetical protein